MSGDELPAQEAVFKPSRWPGLIWAVPVAAVAIVAWLGISAALQNGPSVTVTFPVAGGLEAGTTKVEYQGFDVGEVDDVSLTKGLDQMRVRINFISSMAGHLGPGTTYWLSGSSFSLSDLSQIKELISGPVISIDPHPGKLVDHATGLGQPPVLKYEPQGETITLRTGALGNLSPGSPVFYKGFKVGEIRGLDLDAKTHDFRIYAFIDKAWEGLINSNTRFWSAGAAHLSTTGGGPGVQFESLPALIIGAVAFETPDLSVPAHAVRDGARFKLYDSESDAKDAPGPDAVPYTVTFPGGPRGLQAGAPVQLEGAPAGVVTDVAMQFDPAAGGLRSQVRLVLQPERIGRAGGWNLADPVPQMNAMLNALIGHGLRAELSSSVPVVGGEMVSLELVKGQPAATLLAGAPPGIPVFGAGGGVSDLMAQVNDILASVNAMPLDAIAANIHEATRQLAAMSRSPATRSTLQRLDRTVAQVDAMTAQVNEQLPEILDAVRQSAAQAQAALTQAQGMLSAQGPPNAGPESTSLPHALYELTEASESLRALTDLLDSHPAALITGRSD